MGGLGNQMFQYAFARALAERNHLPFKIDATGLTEERQRGVTTPRKYALWCFNIQENLANDEEVNRLIGQKPESRLDRLLTRLHLAQANKAVAAHLREKGFEFFPEYLMPQDGSYFEGYWQTQKYFVDFERVIRQDFTLKKEFAVDERPIAKEIIANESVSLHIRRGDYVTSASTNKFHGTCSLEYYARGMEYVATSVGQPHYYVFSDDIAWVKDNLKFDHPVTFVSDGTLKDYEELTLMSYCKHNIIANSSFSWWGAWLNRNPEKIVIAPERWFNEGQLNTKDLLPETWVRI